MSGTSLDGVDLAYCRFDLTEKWHFSILKADTIAYPPDILKPLQKSITFSDTELMGLDMLLGTYYGELINAFIGDSPVDFIASHGHTVFHQPEKKLTLQIGRGQAIYEKTGIPVINNFRAKDVALGGQGAPLVPVGDQLLFGDYDYCLNLGGIANISYRENNTRVAFDICPCNLLLNNFAQKLGKAFDEDGALACRGTLINELLQQWNTYDYYAEAYPKSLGYEWVAAHFFNVSGNTAYTPEDLLRTAVEHVASQIATHIRADSSVLITGGGAKNRFLMEQLRKHFRRNRSAHIPKATLVDYKEALIFALLGVLRYRGELNVLASVTGASRDSCTGDMYGF